jgi:hypothetical protein
MSEGEKVDDLKLRLERHDYPLSNDLITQGWLWRGSKRLQALALPPAAWVALEAALARPGGHRDILRFDDCCRAGLASGGEVHDHIEWYEASREAYDALARLRLAAPTSPSEPVPTSESKITTTAAYMIVNSLGATVARTAHATSSVLVDLDADGAVVGIESIGSPVGVGELLDVIRWLRAPALSVSVEPVPSTPRVWAMPRDVRKLSDRHGVIWEWAGGPYFTTGEDQGWEETIETLMTQHGPLTEVEETNDGSE